MSPSLKYLMVSSIAARNASSDPMSLTATLGVELACVLLVMCGLAPDTDRESCWDAPHIMHPNDVTRRTYRNQHGPTTARPAAARAVRRRNVGDHDGTHEDTAQRSGYESTAAEAIETGHNQVSGRSVRRLIPVGAGADRNVQRDAQRGGAGHR